MAVSYKMINIFANLGRLTQIWFKIVDAVVVALAKRNIANMPNGVCGVVSRLHVAESIRRMQITEPLFVRHHVI